MGWFGLTIKERSIWRGIRPGNKIKIAIKDDPNEMYVTNVIERKDNCLRVQTPIIGMTFLEIIPKTVVQVEVEVFNPIHGRIRFTSCVVGQEWSRDRTMEISLPRSLQWIQLRKFFRMEVVLDARYSSVEKKVLPQMLELGYPVFFALVKNISESGALLIIERMAESGIGNFLNLCVDIGHGASIRARAVIMRIEKTQAAGKLGVGVRFLHIKEEDKESLRRFMQTFGREQFLTTTMNSAEN